MFRKSCYSCGSHAVNLLKSSNGWRTIHQFCSHCGKDQTKHALMKSSHTRGRAKIAFSRVKTRTPSKSINLAYAVIFGLLLGVLSIPFTSTSVTYAKEPDHIVEANVMVLTPEQHYRILEDIKTQAFEIKKQLELHQRFEEASKEQIAIAKIAKYAKKYSVSAKELHAIIKCESDFDPDARNKTAKEDSRGVSQINLLVHKVTPEQAHDVDFAVEFLAKHWKEGKRAMWFNCSKKLNLL